MQLQIAVLADFQIAEVDLLRIDADLRVLQDVRRQLVEQLIEPAVEIAELLGFVRRPRKVSPAHAAEKRAEKALREQLLRGIPVFLTGGRQLIETARGTARREYEGVGELLRANGDRPRPASGMPVEGETVVIAVDRLVGVGARTFDAGERHDRSSPGSRANDE